MRREDPTTWPLVDAARLFELRGREAIADVPLPDGTLPVNGTWRMCGLEWLKYRGLCAVRSLADWRALA
jgi:hypothetical protein